MSQLIGGWNNLYFLSGKSRSCDAFVQPVFFLAGNHARNGMTIFFKFKNLFSFQIIIIILHSNIQIQSTRVFEKEDHEVIPI